MTIKNESVGSESGRAERGGGGRTTVVGRGSRNAGGRGIGGSGDAGDDSGGGRVANLVASAGKQRRQAAEDTRHHFVFLPTCSRHVPLAATGYVAAKKSSAVDITIADAEKASNILTNHMYQVLYIRYNTETKLSGSRPAHLNVLRRLCFQTF